MIPGAPPGVTTMAEWVDHLLGVLAGGDPGDLTTAAAAARRNLHQPLRVAVAGRVKAGKSTLINALVGQPVAATDATECTRMVTWYRHGSGDEPRAAAVTAGGDRIPLTYRRTATTATIDVDGLTPDAVRLEVELPLPALTWITIVDTPGTASITRHLSARAFEYLTSTDPSDAPDVVLYLMRYAHEQDLQFLEAYGETIPSDADPLRAVGLLSRADEIGHGRADGMQLASTLAEAMHGQLVSMVTAVRPVSGLLAFAAATLTDDDVAALAALARLNPLRLDAMLRSARAFTAPGAPGRVPPEIRDDLLRRLGLFGVRAALAVLAAGLLADRAGLAGYLRSLSGLDLVERALLHQFAERADLLRSARAVATIERLAPGIADEAPRNRLQAEIDSIKANYHELRELDALRALHLDVRSNLSPADRQLVERTLGAYGTRPYERLGLADPRLPPEDLRRHALARQAALEGIRGATGASRRAVAAALESLDYLLSGLALSDRQP